jgi:hypothetical protein
MMEEGVGIIPRYNDKIIPHKGAITQYMAELIASPDAFFVVLGPVGEPYGMFAASKIIHRITASRTVSVHFWWVDPKKRGGGLVLLRAGLAWGESEGAEMFTIGGSSKRVSKLYKRLGFSRLEDIYAKRAA